MKHEAKCDLIGIFYVCVDCFDQQGEISKRVVDENVIVKHARGIQEMMKSVVARDETKNFGEKGDKEKDNWGIFGTI